MSQFFTEKNPIIDPVALLTDLFMARKLDELKVKAKAMVSDPKYRYVNFESKFNRSGYNLLNDNQMDAALFVFELITELYPTSANAWDSFAEVNWKMKKYDKAIEYYNKSIELDPDGPTGDNSRNMLKQVIEEKEKAN